MALKKSELYSSLWQSCDELRGESGYVNDRNLLIRTGLETVTTPLSQ